MFIILIIAQLAAIIFTVFSIKILYGYIRTYRFHTSEYKLLFGIFHLRQVVVLYILNTIIFAVLSLTTFYLIQ